MHVLMISTDKKIFDPDSAVAERMHEYGARMDALDIVVLSTKKHESLSLAENTTAHSTNARTKIGAIFSAIRLGKAILHAAGDDIVITSQDPFETGVVARQLAKRYNVPYQVQIHTDLYSPHFVRHSLKNRIRLLFAPAVLKGASCIRVVSDRIKQSLMAKHYTPVVLPIYVDIEHIANAEPTHDLKKEYPQFTTHILMAGRLEPEKRYEDALRAFAKVAEKHSQAGLVIAGEGSRRGELERLADILGVARNVIFLGAVDDVHAYMHTADIFFHTALYEGYGLALVEAAASGLPIVTTDVGIVGEVLRNEKNALVCHPTDTRCLVDRLSFLVANKVRRFELGLAAQETAQKMAQNKDEYYTQFVDALERCRVR